VATLKQLLGTEVPMTQAPMAGIQAGVRPSNVNLCFHVPARRMPRASWRQA